jgi:hypothetical protein
MGYDRPWALLSRAHYSSIGMVCGKQRKLSKGTCDGVMCVFQRASVTRLSGCVDQKDFSILQSETNTRMIANLHLHKGSEASVSSYLTMNLMSIKEASRRLSPPADPVVLRGLKFRFTNSNGDKVRPSVHTSWQFQFLTTAIANNEQYLRRSDYFSSSV